MLPLIAAFVAGVTVGVFLASLLVAASFSPSVDTRQGPGDETSRPAPSAVTHSPGRATRRIP